MGLEDSLDLLMKFKNYYDKPPELTDYEAERQQQKQDLTKEREVVENLKPQQTEQTHHICLIVHATLKPYRALLQNQLQATDFECPVVSCAHMNQSNRTQTLYRVKLGCD